MSCCRSLYHWPLTVHVCAAGVVLTAGMEKTFCLSAVKTSTCSAPKQFCHDWLSCLCDRLDTWVVVRGVEVARVAKGKAGKSGKRLEVARAAKG